MGQINIYVFNCNFFFSFLCIKMLVSLNTLPYSVIDMIFTYCSTREMLLNVERVNSLWYSISKRSTGCCWNNVDLRFVDNPQNLNQIVMLLNQRIEQHHIRQLGINKHENNAVRITKNSGRYTTTYLHCNYLFSLNNITCFTKLHTLSFTSHITLLERFDDLSLLTELSTLTIKISYCENIISSHDFKIPSISGLKDLTLINKDALCYLTMIINGNTSPLLRSVRCTSEKNHGKFQVNLIGNVSNLEICHIGNSYLDINDEWLKTASNLYSLSLGWIMRGYLTVPIKDLSELFHPTVLKKLKVLNVLEGLCLTNNDCLFKFINLRHITLPWRVSEAFIKNIKIKLPFFISIHIFQHAEVKINKLTKILPKSTHITLYSPNNFTTPDLVRARENHLFKLSQDE